MTDLFERRLAERLQAHPLPEEIPDLGIRSVRLGQRMRRRHIGAVVAALVLLLIIPVAAGIWRVAAGTREPPVTSPTSTPQTSASPKLVVLQYRYRSLGAPPEVGTVRGRSVRLVSGKTVRLPADQFGSVTEYGSGLAWLSRNGGDFRLNVSPERLPITTNGSEVTGAEPGPASWRSESKRAQHKSDRTWCSTRRVGSTFGWAIRLTASTWWCAVWPVNGALNRPFGESDRLRATEPKVTSFQPQDQRAGRY